MGVAWRDYLHRNSLNSLSVGVVAWMKFLQTMSMTNAKFTKIAP